MACRYYNNAGCGGCGGCTRFVKSTAVVLTDGVLNITIPARELSNREPLCLCIAQSIPAEAGAATMVNVLVGTQNLAVITNRGNRMYADQLRTRRIILLRAATDLPYLVADPCCLCPTKHIFPVLPAQDTPPATLNAKGAKANE